MPFLTVGESQLYHEVHGEGSPLVLMHGVGGNRVSWFQQIPSFARHHRTVVIDQRGFGLSTDAEEIGRSAMHDDLRHVLDALAIDRATLVAQSMSGGAAVGFTCRHPDRVASLVLADTVQGIVLDAEQSRLMEAMLQAGEALTPIERVFGPTFVANAPEQVLLYRQISSFNRYNARTISGSFPQHTPSELAASAVPVLFMAGTEERRCPVPVIRSVCAMVAGAEYVEIERAGHSVYFEQPALFNQAVLSFVSAHG